MKASPASSGRTTLPSDAPAYRVQVICRNRFFEGETLEVLSPAADEVRTCEVRDLVWHVAPESDVADVEKRGEGFELGPDPAVAGGKLAKVTVANRTMERYSFALPFPLQEGDILRISRTNQDKGRNLV